MAPPWACLVARLLATVGMLEPPQAREVHSHRPGVGMTITCRRDSNGASVKPAPLAQQTHLLLRRRETGASVMPALLPQTTVLLGQPRAHGTGASEKPAPLPRTLHRPALLCHRELCTPGVEEKVQQRVPVVVTPAAHPEAGVHQVARRRLCSVDEMC